MARYGRILLLAALAGLLMMDIDGGPGRSAQDRAFRGTAIAAEAVGTSTQGVTVTRPVPSVSESLSDIQARAPFLQGSPPRDRHIPRRRIPRSADTGLFSPQLSLSLSPAAPIAAAPVPRAPALDAPFPNGFAGLANPIPPGDVIPPDTMGAAGPLHLVSLLNSGFGVFLKATGTPLSSMSLETFWSSLGTGAGQPAEPPFNPFDTKILFDTNSQRFVAVTLEADDGPPSWVMIAMSQDSNPTGIWYKVAIRADVGTDNTFWADYPGLGVDANNIYITANMFNTAATSQFQGSKVWVVSKGEPLLNGGTGDLTFTEIRLQQSSGDSIQPAQTFGLASEYFIREAGSGTLGLATITGGTTWTDLGPISVASFASTSLPAAPQFGDTRGIDTSDTRLLNAVFRNNSLWTTHNVLGSNGRVEVAWYQINPGPPVSLVTQGRINDPDPNSARWYYYPSIAVNQNNDVAIGFSGSSASEYVSAYYTAQSSTGLAANVMQSPSLLKTGVASYYKAGITFPGGTDTTNRWGDFSATVVDPTDNLTFWTLQEYAESPATVHGELRSMWGTWWGRFRAPAIASPSLSAMPVSTTQVNLSWTMQEGQGQRGFQVERRNLPGGDFGVPLITLGASATTYVDNTGVGGTTYSYRVRALSPDSGPDSYSNEVTAVTMSPPQAASGGGGGGCSMSDGRSRTEDYSTRAGLLVLLLPLPILWARRRILRILLMKGIRQGRR